MRCPCGGALVEGPASGGFLAGCEHCGGAWLDNEELTLLAREMSSAETLAFIRACDERGAAAAATAKDEGYRTPSRLEGGCPVCGEALVETALRGGVSVDVCEAHGTFFDRAEIRTLRFDQAVSSAGAVAAVTQQRLQATHNAEHLRLLEERLKRTRRGW